MACGRVELLKLRPKEMLPNKDDTHNLFAKPDVKAR